MVTISNGMHTFEVPYGAYKSVFKKQGFSVVDDLNGANNDEAGNPGMQSPNGAEHDTSDDKGDAIAELEEKPIAQWSKEELKLYADAKGIDLYGATSVNEVRRRIKAFMA